jgi:hypothetical protein
MTSFADPRSCCSAISQALGQLSSPKSRGHIGLQALEQFFSQCARSFGEESDGKTEARDLIQLLQTQQITTEVSESPPVPSDHLKAEVTRGSFEAWLLDRFFQHPQHLVELVNVVRLIELTPKAGQSTNPTTTATTATTATTTAATVTATATNNTTATQDYINQLKQEKAALHQKVQDVSNHHGRILKTALNAARAERTSALHNGLAELQEKNKRMEMLLAKRDAQIQRLKTQLKPLPPPVVSPSKSRNHAPGKRRAIPDLHATLQSPTRRMVSNVEANEQDLLTPPPSIRRQHRQNSSHRRNLRKRQRELGHEEEKSKHDNRLFWETTPLDWVTHETDPQLVYNAALLEIQVLFGLFNGLADNIHSVERKGTVHEKGPPTSEGSSSNHTILSRFQEQKDAAFLYHANAARTLLRHSLLALPKPPQRECLRVLKGKILGSMAVVCDLCDDVTTAIEFGKRAGNLWKSLGLAKRSLSASMHILAMSCETNDLDKAEILAMRLVEKDTTNAGVIDLSHVHGYLALIRTAIQQNTTLTIDRSRGWPLTIELDK